MAECYLCDFFSPGLLPAGRTKKFGLFLASAHLLFYEIPEADAFLTRRKTMFGPSFLTGVQLWTCKSLTPSAAGTPAAV
ncbi:protein of unknown function [Methylocaldum szegediense]|jgi:hypothetical protein|uniref:Uncharacterized protein n=1 Tax=Methylocaldum szegediense TaxID=73780 RepID=A0ABM9I1E0_9GAMM|nr:protein of unknown function [Methylocaldum szegediense]